MGPGAARDEFTRVRAERRPSCRPRGGVAVMGGSSGESSEDWLAHWPHLASQRAALIQGLASGDIVGSYSVALQTCALLRNVAGTCRWSTASELLRRLRWVGCGVVEAEPLELASGNVLRRCLLIVREEYGRLLRERDAAPEDASLQPSLQDVLLGTTGSTSSSGASGYGETPLEELKQNVIEQIVELYDEIETCREPIAAQSVRHVNENDVVLTLGNSRSVRAFLKHAASKSRTFEVFVAEAAPSGCGRLGAELLAKACPNCTVTVVPDSSVFALMARVRRRSPTAISSRPTRERGFGLRRVRSRSRSCPLARLGTRVK